MIKIKFIELYEELSEINDAKDNRNFFEGLLDELSEFDYAFIDIDGKELNDEEAMQAAIWKAVE